MSNPHSALQLAKSMGFHGFGGNCGQAAVAINRVIFNNEGRLVGAFNEAFFEHGHYFGHIAVEDSTGSFWDADARPKHLDDIESWAMLDTSDPDYEELAEQLGIEWNDETASAVATFQFEEQEILETFGSDKLDAMCNLLEEASR